MVRTVVQQLILAAFSMPIWAATAAIAPDRILAMRTFNWNKPADLSPDGAILAFAVQDPGRREPINPRSSFSATGVPIIFVGSDIWLAEVATGESRSLTRGRGSSWGPVWSPDGKRLAFYSDRDGAARVWLWERKAGRLRRLGTFQTRGGVFDQLCWTPDGRKLVVKQARPEMISRPSPTQDPEPKGEAGGVRVFESGPGQPRRGRTVSPVLTAHRADLVLIDADTGHARILAKDTIAVWVAVSPSGKEMAYFSSTGVDPATGAPIFDLVLVSLIDSQTHALRKGVSVTRQASWSRDGRFIAYPEAGGVVIVPVHGGPVVHAKVEGQRFTPVIPLWSGRDDEVYAIAGSNSLYGVSLDGRVRLIAQIPGYSVEALLSRYNRNSAWEPRAGSIAGICRDQVSFQTAFCEFRLEGGRPLLYQESDFQIGGDNAAYASDVADNGSRLVFLREDSARTPDFWMLPTLSATPRRVSRVNEQIDEALLGRETVVEWQADGKACRGLLLLPPDRQPGKPLPLLVWVYGASLRYKGKFGWSETFFNPQLFASRGYAVLYPDVPAARDGEPMALYARVVVPGIESLVRSGLVDPARIGVFGHSHGGYATLALITESSVFKAALVSAGPADLISLYGALLTDGSSPQTMVVRSEFEMKGSPWQARDQYIRNSPFFALDHVETPLLLIQGTADTERLGQSNSTFVGLRDLGKTATYVQYDGEDHSPITWSQEHRLDAANRILAWFERYLGSTRSGPSGHDAR